MKTFFEKKADPNLLDSSNKTSLQVIGENKEDSNQLFQICQFLLENKADPNTKNEENMTPFHYFCKKANTQVLNILLDSKADTNVKIHHFNFNIFFLSFFFFFKKS